jgi:DeoR/GlpR family transcriptional regulator of sugar metabolism
LVKVSDIRVGFMITIHETTRKQQLLDLLAKKGYLDVKTVAKEMGVSAVTARRDIRNLTRENLAVRTHGGVHLLSPFSTTYEYTMLEKRRLMAAEKEAIGRLAAKLVVPGESVLIDAGSTTYQVAKYIRYKKPQTVVSNDIHILSLLADNVDLNIIDPGGTVRGGFGTLLGPDTFNFIQSLNVNTLFLGADAVDLKAGVTVANREEVEVKRSMIAVSNRVILVMDHSKLGKVAFSRVCDLQSVHTIVTDKGIDQEEVEKIQSLKIELLIANDHE